MAGIARNAPPESRQDLFREAYQTAWSANEDFRRVFDSSLVMEAELQVGRSLDVNQLERALQESMRLEHTLNRAVAVAGLWQTIFSVGPLFTAKVQKMALKTALETKSWKSLELLREMFSDFNPMTQKPPVKFSSRCARAESSVRSVGGWPNGGIRGPEGVVTLSRLSVVAFYQNENIGVRALPQYVRQAT